MTIIWRLSTWHAKKSKLRVLSSSIENKSTRTRIHTRIETAVIYSYLQHRANVGAAYGPHNHFFRALRFIINKTAPSARMVREPAVNNFGRQYEYSTSIIQPRVRYYHINIKEGSKPTSENTPKTRPQCFDIAGITARGMTHDHNIKASHGYIYAAVLLLYCCSVFVIYKCVPCK